MSFLKSKFINNIFSNLSFTKNCNHNIHNNSNNICHHKIRNISRSSDYRLLLFWCKNNMGNDSVSYINDSLCRNDIHHKRTCFDIIFLKRSKIS